MKIALISYEYPPDTAFGGIGTYVYQIAQLMQARGHHIEIFAGSLERSGMWFESGIPAGIVIHRTQSTRSSFAEAIAPIFARRHQIVQFDVLEGPECGAEAYEAMLQVPKIPRVVKLHTPSSMVAEINAGSISLSQRFRWYLGAIRRGHWPQAFPSGIEPRIAEREQQNALAADLVTTPSECLGDILIQRWGLDPANLIQVANPYMPSLEYLQIPVETQTSTVSFVGRLEIRKGILEFVRAIPQILRQHPHTKFRLIGARWPSSRQALKQHQQIDRILAILADHADAIELTGAVPLPEIPKLLAKTDICVFPSRWENFPNVCLEAMAAARGIVASRAGGMAEMLEQGRCGILIDPQSPQQITQAVVTLLEQPALRMRYGQLARDRVLSHYGSDRIGELQERAYQRAIQRASQRTLQNSPQRPVISQPLTVGDGNSSQ